MKRLLSAFVALIMTITIITVAVPVNSAALSAAELSAARRARSQLSGLMNYYERYIIRVSEEQNLSDPDFVRYRDELMPQARELLANSEYSLASAYNNMEYALEDCWMTWRKHMPISRGINSYWAEAQNKIPSYLGYTQSSVNEFLGYYELVEQRVNTLANSTVSRDTVGYEILNRFDTLISNLEAKTSDPATVYAVATAAEEQYSLEAKTELADKLEAYDTMAEGIADSNSRYADMFRTELALLHALNDSETLYECDSYFTSGAFDIDTMYVLASGKEIVNKSAYELYTSAYLDASCMKVACTLRSYYNYVKALASVGGEVLDICTDDSIGDTAAANSVKELIAGAPQLRVDMWDYEARTNARDTLVEFINAVGIQADRDTKEEKSPETIQMYKYMDEAAADAVNYLTVSTDTLQAIFTTLESYCEQVYTVALPVGTPFQRKAKALYYQYADVASNYTTDSWSAVVKAMDYCDYIKNDGFDFECAGAYKRLSDAINALVLRPNASVSFTVTGAECAAGDRVTVTVGVDDNVGFIYGHFYLYFDTDIFTYVSSTCPEVTVGANGILAKPDFSIGITQAQTVFTVTLEVNKNAVGGDYIIDLEVDRVRDISRFLFENVEAIDGKVTVTGAVAGDIDESGDVSISDALTLFKHVAGIALIGEDSLRFADLDRSGAAEISDALNLFKTVAGVAVNFETTVTFGDNESTAEIGTVSEIPDYTPEEGYLFNGWTDGIGLHTVGNKLIVSGKPSFTADTEKFVGGAIRKNELLISGYVTLYSLYATEQNFVDLRDNGIDLIILDYDHNSNNAIYEQTVRWAEKYGIRAYICDYNLLSIGTWNEEIIKRYTAAYSSSPSFVGNFLCDEPGYDALDGVAAKVKIYEQAMPGYDIHVNNFAIKSYVEKYESLTDRAILSFDPYPLSSSEYGEPFTSSNYYNELQPCSDIARQSGRTSCVYIQTMSGMSNRKITLADIRFQMYAALAYGNSIILHYCYGTPGFTGTPTPSGTVYGMIDLMLEKTIIYDYAQTANTEVKALAEYIENFDYIDTQAIYGRTNTPAYVKTAPRYTGDRDISCSDALLIGMFEDSDTDRKGYVIANATELIEEKTVSVTVEMAANEIISVIIGGKTVFYGSPVDTTVSFTLPSGGGAYVLVEKL